MSEPHKKSTDSLNLPSVHPAVLIATFGHAGYLPKAPGTWASALALPFAWILLDTLGRLGLIAATVLVLAIGLWASAKIIRSSGITDPSFIVIDEVVGQWIAVWAIEPDLLLFALAFALFRLADIAKPWPVSWAERRLPGTYGVMMDDVVAGIMAGIVVYALSVWI